MEKLAVFVIIVLLGAICQGGESSSCEDKKPTECAERRRQNEIYFITNYCMATKYNRSDITDYYSVNCRKMCNLCRVQTCEEILEEARGDLDQCTETMDEHTAKTANQLRAIETSYYYTFTYKGHTYLLPKINMKRNISEFEVICGAHGGYLAEINDEDEFKAMQTFLEENGIYGTPVMLGATDKETEGTWKFMHSGHPVQYFNWGGGYPSIGRTDYACYYVYTWLGNNQFKMYDGPCVSSQYVRFLCEKPKL